MWLLYAIAAAVLWGLSYSLSEKILSSNIAPVTLLASQMLLGAFLFTGVAYSSSLKADLATLSHNRTLFWLLIAELLVACLGNYFISMSIQAKNATLAGLIELCYPIFTVIFTYLLFKQNHFNISVLIGGCLIFSGVLVISYFA